MCACPSVSETKVGCTIKFGRNCTFLSKLSLEPRTISRLQLPRDRLMPVSSTCSISPPTEVGAHRTATLDFKPRFSISKSRDTLKIASKIKFTWLKKAAVPTQNTLTADILRSGQLASRSTIANSLSMIGIKKIMRPKEKDSRKDIEQIVQEIESGTPYDPVKKDPEKPLSREDQLQILAYTIELPPEETIEAINNADPPENKADSEDSQVEFSRGQTLAIKDWKNDQVLQTENLQSSKYNNYFKKQLSSEKALMQAMQPGTEISLGDPSERAGLLRFDTGFTTNKTIDSIPSQIVSASALVKDAPNSRANERFYSSANFNVKFKRSHSKPILVNSKSRARESPEMVARPSKFFVNAQGVRSRSPKRVT